MIGGTKMVKNWARDQPVVTRSDDQNHYLITADYFVRTGYSEQGSACGPSSDALQVLVI
jgi:hypothetical protein